MRIMRLGEYLKERPAVQVSDTEAVFVDHVIPDWNRESLASGGLQAVGRARNPRSMRRLAAATMPGTRPGSAACHVSPVLL